MFSSRNISRFVQKDTGATAFMHQGDCVCNLPFSADKLERHGHICIPCLKSFSKDKILSLLYVLNGCMCVCRHTCVHIPEEDRGSPRMSFLIAPHFIDWERNLSLKPEVDNVAPPATQLASAILCLLLNSGVTSEPPHPCGNFMGAGETRSSLHTCVASTWTCEPSSQSLKETLTKETRYLIHGGYSQLHHIDTRTPVHSEGRCGQTSLLLL